MHTPRASYLPEVDGLRAVAVLLVLLFHFGVVDLGHAGFIGVDVFFVISGFLITGILLRQLDSGRFSLADFYTSRIRRLAPSLLVVVVLTVAWGATRQFPEQFTELVRQAILSQLYLVNFHFYANVGYFGLRAADVPLLHLWSLAVEEHFYIFYPLGLLLLHRHARRYLWWGIVVAALVSFALNLALVGKRPELTFYMLPTRAWELLAGALAAGIASRWPLGARAREAALVGGLAFIALALAVHRPSTPFPGTFALLPVAGGMLVVLSAGTSPTRISGLLSNRVMTYVGRISYPLYLVHWPIHVFSRDALGEGYGLPQRWLMLASAVAMAALLFHFVEEPVRERRILVARWKLLSAYAGGVALVAAAFVLVRVTDGLPSRFPADVQALAGFVNDKSPPLSECQFVGRPLTPDSPACRIGDPAAPVTWLVYGDSHAWAAHGAMDAWLRRGAKAGVLLYRNSCPPNLGLHVLGDSGQCVGFNTNMVQLLEREKSLRNVFLVSTWLQPVERRLSPQQGQDLDREQSIAAFNRAFDDLLLRLSAAGKRVYVWEPVPGAKGPVPLALARARLEGRNADLEFTRSEYDQQYAFFFDALDRNQARIQARFSPAAALCKPTPCSVVVDGKPVYFDNSHISRSPAGFWADAMQAAGVVP